VLSGLEGKSKKENLYVEMPGSFEVDRVFFYFGFFGVSDPV